MLKKVFILCAVLSAFYDAYAGPTLRIACRSKGIEKELLAEAIAEWRKGRDVDVEIITLPRASNECYILYQQLLFSKQCDLDVILLDNAWVGSFADHLENLLDYEIIRKNRQRYFQSIENTIFVKNRLIALPMYADVGVFFYRKDLLEKYSKPVPKTWDEVYETAKYIQEQERALGNKNFYGYVFQGKATEILTCVYLEVLDSFGGKIATDTCTYVDSDISRRAVAILQKFYKDVCPVGIPNHSEEESRGIFQCGNALFMRNWPYAALAGKCESLKGKVGMTVIPTGVGNRHSGTLGGWNLGIPKLSKRKKLAAELIAFLASKTAQKMRAIKGHYPPAVEELYDDPEILKDNPSFCILKDALKSAVSRPARYFGRNYQQVSTLISGTINTAIAESRNCRYNLNRDLKKLNKKITRLLISRPKKKKKGALHKLRLYIEDKWNSCIKRGK